MVVAALPLCVSECVHGTHIVVFYSHTRPKITVKNTRKLHRRLFGYAHHPTLYRVSQNQMCACKKLHTTKYNELYLGSRLFSRYVFLLLLLIPFAKGDGFFSFISKTHTEKKYFIYYSGIYFLLLCLPFILWYVSHFVFCVFFSRVCVWIRSLSKYACVCACARS